MTQNKRVLTIAIIGLLFASSTYLLGWSQVFSVREVAITGVPTEQSAVEVKKALEITPGIKMARVEPRSLRRRLDSFGWIGSVNISRNWINRKVSIEISPRVPIAEFNPLTSPQMLMDSEGKLFKLPGNSNSNLPRVEAADTKSGLLAIDLFTSLPQSFRSSIVLMSARSSGTFSVTYLFGGRSIRIVWGDAKNTSLKVEVINALLGLPENSKISTIDVSAPHAPIVK
jgi:cell division septal protein FtsQ